MIPFIAAYFNRLRGRGDFGNQPGRLLVALVLSVPIWSTRQNIAGTVFIFLTWLAFTWGWGKWMNCRNWRETLFMSLRGVLITAPIAVLPLLGNYSSVPFGLATTGLLMGPIYLTGRLLAANEPFLSFLQIDPDPIAISEVLFGFWLGTVMMFIDY